MPSKLNPMEIVASLQVAVPNGSATAIAGSKLRVKAAILSARGGTVAIGPDDSTAVGSQFEIEDGGALPIDAAGWGEIDLAGVYAAADEDDVVLHVLAMD